MKECETEKKKTPNDWVIETVKMTIEETSTLKNGHIKLRNEGISNEKLVEG